MCHSTGGGVLFAQAEVERERLPAGEVLASTETTINAIREIAKECNDEQIAGWADLSEGDAYYIMMQSNMAVEPLKRALTTVKDPDFRLYLLRVIALVASYLDEVNTVVKMGKEIDEVAKKDGVSLNRICHAYEGLARAYIQVKRPELAAVAVQKALDVHNQISLKGKRSPIRLIQAKRSELLFVVSFQPEDKALIHRVGTEAAHLAQQDEKRYPRYPDQIKHILNQHLN